MNRDETIAIYKEYAEQSGKGKKKSNQLINLEMKIEALVGLIELLTNVATFADAQDDDWFKLTLAEIGALEWALDLLMTLKKITDSLEEAKVYNS